MLNLTENRAEEERHEGSCGSRCTKFVLLLVLLLSDLIFIRIWEENEKSLVGCAAKPSGKEGLKYQYQCKKCGNLK